MITADLLRRIDRSLPDQGRQLVVAAWIGTAVFVVTALVAVFVPAARIVSAVVALVLFGVGCVAFLMAYARAVDRSRTEEIGIGGLYFLAGSAPRGVRLHLMGATAIQTVIAFATASLRPFTALAFGILVPMFGLGVAGLWAARFGEFPRRTSLKPNRQSSPSGKPPKAGKTP